jgi:sugar phosphate isomerase/epimerase
MVGLVRPQPLAWPLPTLAGSTLVLAVRPRERPASQEAPAAWASELGELAEAGFTAIDLVDSWLSPAELSRSRLEDLSAAIAATGLAVVGVSVVRRSVIDPQDGDENLEVTLRTLEAAASLGAPLLSIGFHRPLTKEQRASKFWLVPSPEDARDDATWRLATERVATVARRAAELGVDISLELHEGTLLDSALGALRIIDAVGAENLGINADLGNLVRVPRPLERSWEEELRAALPALNYWHVKNYVRIERPAAGEFVSAPSDLSAGVIDYRRALRLAVEHGYRGPLCIEHYEGDALSVIANGRRYLEQILRDVGAGAA